MTSTSTTQPNMNDSKSLWNYTMSPGWTEKEVEVFRFALMKFGLGRWTRIVEEGCLPGKTVGQLNNQMQRMIGQQSTGEFQGLHCDPQLIFAHNAAREGVRKNGCLINTGENPTPESVKRKRDENQARWGLSQADIDAIVIPVLKSEETSSSVLVVTIEARNERLTMLEALQGELAALAVKKAGGETLVSAGTMELLENSARIASNINLKLLADMKRKEAGLKKSLAATTTTTAAASSSTTRGDDATTPPPRGASSSRKRKTSSSSSASTATVTKDKSITNAEGQKKRRVRKSSASRKATTKKPPPRVSLPLTEYASQRPQRARKPTARYDDDDDDDFESSSFDDDDDDDDDEEEEGDDQLNAAIRASLTETTSTSVTQKLALPEETLMTLAIETI